MKCPSCGAENDAANRFCDQCGTRLEPSGATAQPPADIAAHPTMAGSVCPRCGAAVLPGEAFCDECGAALGSATPAAGAGYDAPTMYAPPTAGAGQPGDQSLICSACGHQNLPGDRFCDNCGASLSGQTTAPTPAEAPTVDVNEELLRRLHALPAQGQPSSPMDATIVAPPQQQPAPEQQAQGQPSSPMDATIVAPPQQQPAPEQQAPAQEAQGQPSSSMDATIVAPPQQQPAPEQQAPAQEAEGQQAPQPATTTTPEQPGSAQADYEARRRQLEEEIARQQQIIAQFEQMQALFGAAAPVAVAQGLAEARDALARAQNDLDSLKPPVDPAEVARLQEEIARQDQIIAQFEQMQALFGAATPPAVGQGLAEARANRARFEAELAALGAGPGAPAQPQPTQTPEAPPTTQAPPETATPAPDQPQEEVPPVATPVAEAEAPTVLAETPVQPPPPPPPPAHAPRLVIDENGKELPLAPDKQEFVIGREDPISGIHPEIDLTPYGGESGGVSRQHARISRGNGQWTITDLNSTNYTRVDGNKIEPSTPVPIQDGSRLQFGRVAVTFRE